jgi:hypothetical protein
MFKDKVDLNLKGQVKIKINGEIVFSSNNLVVSKSRDILRHLLFDADPQKIIKYIKFGNGGTGDDVTKPISPELSDTNLNGDIIISKTVKKVLKDDNKILYSAIIEKNEANGDGTEIITEAGLFNLDDEMFARITFPAIIKTPIRQFELQWTLIF